MRKINIKVIFFGWSRIKLQSQDLEIRSPFVIVYFQNLTCIYKHTPGLCEKQVNADHPCGNNNT